MTLSLSFSFASLDTPKEGVIVIPSSTDNLLGDTVGALEGADKLARSFEVAEFTGKSGTSVDVLTPSGMVFDRLIAIGVGAEAELGASAWIKIGGSIGGALKAATNVAIVAEVGATRMEASEIADLAAGIMLRAYSFDRHKSKKDKSKKKTRITICCGEPARAKSAFSAARGMAEGVCLARDLVNEPANVMGPVELAERAKALENLGVKVEVMGEKDMRKLGMGALLGVSQGSSRPARLVSMSWHGGKKDDAPLALVGKGVVFDTGGNSMKSAGGMEDMRGDMGGAAAVIGAMHAIASRKAKANVVGIIGCVENMVDGNAQRPGDIVTSMSGQTIEVLNTDAEGRLVLADALWYCQQTFKPKAIVDLATLTGAIMVALGQHYAGLFSNDDDLSRQLTESGLAVNERVWRMPMGPEFDKLIDSKSADMKNIGGRYGGAVSAAQFIQRFIKDTPWAHLDIAGTAISAPSSEISQSWASGFGVRLLDRLVKDSYES